MLKQDKQLHFLNGIQIPKGPVSYQGLVYNF